MKPVPQARDCELGGAGAGQVTVMVLEADAHAEPLQAVIAKVQLPVVNPLTAAPPVQEVCRPKLIGFPLMVTV